MFPGRGANWAAWQPGTCQVGRLVCPPGGPFAMSNVEVGQTTYSVNSKRVGRREGSEEDREGGCGTGKGAREP